MFHSIDSIFVSLYSFYFLYHSTGSIFCHPIGSIFVSLYSFRFCITTRSIFVSLVPFLYHSTGSIFCITLLVPFLYHSTRSIFVSIYWFQFGIALFSFHLCINLLVPFLYDSAGSIFVSLCSGFICVSIYWFHLDNRAITWLLLVPANAMCTAPCIRTMHETN